MSDLFSNPKSNLAAAIPTETLKSEKGIVIKQGKFFPQKDKLFAINTYYKTSNKAANSKIYALIVVFEK